MTQDYKKKTEDKRTIFQLFILLEDHHQHHQSLKAKILKHLKFILFKIHLVQEQNEDDPDRRVQFCKNMEHLIATQSNFLFGICFSKKHPF